MFNADKLNGYKTGFANAIPGRNPLADMVADAAINGVHPNNKRERLNGKFRDCPYRARGFSPIMQGLARLAVVYTHKGSRKETPAGAAGVMVGVPTNSRRSYRAQPWQKSEDCKIRLQYQVMIGFANWGGFGCQIGRVRLFTIWYVFCTRLVDLCV